MSKKPDAKNAPQNAGELSEDELEQVAGGRYLEIRMKKVYITSYQTGGSAGESLPMEQLSLNFAKVQVEYDDN